MTRRAFINNQTIKLMKKDEKDNFVMLTYAILGMEGLTSTDKIVLAARLGWGTLPYFQQRASMAKELGMNRKTVEKSITKLKKMGHWPDKAAPTRVGVIPTGVGKNSPTRVGDGPTGVEAIPTPVDDKKPISPVKTGALLDSSLDKKLEKADKIVGLDGSPLSVSKKFVSEVTVTSETLGVGVNFTSGSEALIDSGIELTGLAAPLDSNGQPMTYAEMSSANFEAALNGKPEPYTQAQVDAAEHAPHRVLQGNDDFETLFGT